MTKITRVEAHALPAPAANHQALKLLSIAVLAPTLLVFLAPVALLTLPLLLLLLPLFLSA